jgi:molybdate transport system substrate-binding protein
MLNRLSVCALLALDLCSPPAFAQAASNTVKVMTADALRGAMTLVARDFEATHPGTQVQLVFASTSQLSDRLAAGEAADAFAATSMAHPVALAMAGRAEPVDRFARNGLCGLATPAFQLHGRKLAERLLDPLVKVGIGAPKTDPAGEFALALFDRIEAQRQGPTGAAAQLKTKALQLVGGPDAPATPAGANPYGHVVAQGLADIFLTHCTQAFAAQRERPALQVLPVPGEIDVPTAYGLALLKPTSALARQFAAHVMSTSAQQRLASVGLSAP